jgi:hypothetical protein
VLEQDRRSRLGLNERHPPVRDWKDRPLGPRRFQPPAAYGLTSAGPGDGRGGPNLAPGAVAVPRNQGNQTSGLEVCAGMAMTDPNISWQRTFPECEPGTDGVGLFEGRIIGRIRHDRFSPRDPVWAWSVTDPELAGRPRLVEHTGRNALTPTSHGPPDRALAGDAPDEPGLRHALQVCRASPLARAAADRLSEGPEQDAQPRGQGTPLEGIHFQRLDLGLAR